MLIKYHAYISAVPYSNSAARRHLIDDFKNIPSIEDALDEYYADARFERSILGAESAWRGYELQTLYICSKVLSDKSENFQYRPESVEDLLICDSRGERPSIELVQVKAKNEGLALSDLTSKQEGRDIGKEDTLFGHLRFFFEKGIDVSAKVVVFGTLGDELSGFSRGIKADKSRVADEPPRVDWRVLLQVKQPKGGFHVRSNKSIWKERKEARSLPR